MMFGHDFYHGALRRYVIMFGNLFNEIQVERYSSDGIKLQTISVPIEYSPKQKFVQRVLGDPELTRNVSTTLPRLGFEFTSITYAPQRKLNSAHKIVRGVDAGGTDFNYTYTPVPYDINFSLYALVRYAEDGTQIVEQIIPFFTPDWTVTMKLIPELGINMDIPIELTGVNVDDSYEGDFDGRRILSWQMDFTVKGYLFGPSRKFKYISNAEINTFIDTSIVNVQTFEGDENFTVTET